MSRASATRWSRALASEGLAISTVQTAGEGLERIRRDSPDAVLLDLRLPDMSGLEACTLIRQIDARLPVILITAHGTTETAIEAMKLGAFDYLLKPLASASSATSSPGRSRPAR